MTRGLYPLWMVDKLLGKLDFADPGEEVSRPFSTTGIAEITKMTGQWPSASFSSFGVDFFSFVLVVPLYVQQCKGSHSSSLPAVSH